MSNHIIIQKSGTGNKIVDLHIKNRSEYAEKTEMHAVTQHARRDEQWDGEDWQR